MTIRETLIQLQDMSDELRDVAQVLKALQQRQAAIVNAQDLLMDLLEMNQKQE